MRADNQLNNFVTTNNSSDRENGQIENNTDLWIVYAYKREVNAPSKIGFIRANIYKSLKPSDRVSVDSGEITTDLNIYTKDKRKIQKQLFYEENSNSPALFTEQEIRRPGGPIERRECKSFRAGTNTVLLTQDAKYRLRARKKKNECNIQNTSHLSEVFTETTSNGCWLAYSYRTIIEYRSYNKVAYIKKAVYDKLSRSDHVLVHTGQITTDASIQTRDKKQINKGLYYEENSKTPALFTEDEIRRPDGPIEKRGHLSFRAGTSTALFTYQSRSCRSLRLISSSKQIDKDISFHNGNFELFHAPTLNIESQSNSINDEIFSIPDNILQMMIEKPVVLSEESVKFSNSEQSEKEDSQIEMKNSSDIDQKHCTDNNNNGFCSTNLIQNFDEVFSDPYWEQFREIDEEAPNFEIEHGYQNSFKLFQPTICDLEEHTCEIEEQRNPKRHKSNS